MLWRLKELFDGGGELIRAEAELAMNRLKRGLLAAVLLFAALAVAVLGLGVLLAGLTTALAAETGWIIALCIVGGVLLVLALLAAWPALHTLRNPFSHDELSTHPLIRAAESRHQMADAVNPSVSKEEAKGLPQSDGRSEPIPTDFEGMKNTAVDFVTRHPAAVASGVFLALSVVGPFRAIRLLSRGLAVAGLVTTVVESMREDNRPERQHSRPTPPTPPIRPDRPERPIPHEPPPAPSSSYRAVTEPKPNPAIGRYS